MTDLEDWLSVGKIVAPQGLKGELRVYPTTDFPERFTKPGKRWLQNKFECPREYELIGGRKLPGKLIFIIRLKGINDRDNAQELIGQKLLVPKSSRPKLAKGEFHLLDLIGLEVKINPNEPALGKVINLKTAGNDLLEIKLEIGRTVLIPFVTEIVPEVHLKERWIRITPPPGLLEL